MLVMEIWKMKFVKNTIYNTIKNQISKYKSRKICTKCLPRNQQNTAKRHERHKNGGIYHGLEDSLLRYLFCTNCGVHRVYIF